ncbi:hypothetical protein EYC80_004174 [Monilinia laxa]|uniref:Uncharacterized protein n=1 Tax=Monilinia laxa TaxID=61186 RepID=A0A5N6KM54_MONLA|nr:hypothetical protein EYC80_004174 [Monilinia laxa]
MVAMFDIIFDIILNITGLELASRAFFERPSFLRPQTPSVINTGTFYITIYKINSYATLSSFYPQPTQQILNR